MKNILFILLSMTALYANSNLSIVGGYEGSDTIEVQIGAGRESCTVWVNSHGTIDRESCHYMVNSKGVKIYCTPRKKVCKTHDELYSYVQQAMSEPESYVNRPKIVQHRDYQQCLDSSDGSTIAMSNCNADELEYQDNILNKNYKEAMGKLGNRQRDQLKKIQRMWMKYRDTKCDFWFEFSGGTMDRLLGASCRIDTIKHRAKELKEIADSAS